MRRAVGLTRDELETRERVFDGLTMKAVRRSVRALTASHDAVLTAAVTVSSTPSEPNPTLPAGALGVVTTTWSQEVDEVLYPFLVQTFVDAAEDVYASMPETTGVAPKITYDLAATYLRGASNRLRGIGDVVWNDMRTQLALGYGAGESINQLAARLRTVAKISEPRALTIARTEVVPAANFGSLTQLKAVGFTDEECRKEWLATEDGRTRPAHLEADGQLVGLSQPFVVDGDYLQVPGDPRGRAENVINCRCSVAYVFDEDGDGDGDGDDEPLVAHGDNHNQKDHGNWADGDADSGSSSPFKILPKSRRGKSGDRMYAPGMWGRYGGAGIMMRHVGADGVPRYMVVQRSNPGYNKWRWQLPGGARDQHETAAQAAAREAAEEIGVTQEQLDTLEPRGAHVVRLPVEGKDPWTYSSVVADAPEAFKPKIDYKELGAARWLTYDQLVEMRGRNRLIAPFAAQLEDIIARFDEPLTAGFLVTQVTTSQDHVGYYTLMTASRWTAADEAKVKRDKEGKFAKKAGSSVLAHALDATSQQVVAVGTGSTAGRRIRKSGSGFYAERLNAHGQWKATTKKMTAGQLQDFLETGTWDIPQGDGDTASQVKKVVPATITQHVPLHINTAVIYKKGGHKDNEVVATKPGTAETEGAPQRLMWSEKLKRFLLQGQLDNGSWISVEVYTKKAAYDKFSKETGWQKPAKAESVGAIPPLPKKAAVPSKFPYLLVEAAPAWEIDEWLSKLTQDEYDVFTSSEKDTLDKKVTQLNNPDLIAEHAKFLSGTKGKKPVTAPSLKDLAAQKVADKMAAVPIVVKEMTEVAPQLGKPIHINTTAIYKTKYADGAVVAEKEPPGGMLKYKQRLVWNGKKKEFSYQEFINGKWVELNAYNKGEAYKEFSKQTGWTHPVIKPPTPAKVIAPTKKASELSAGEALFVVGESTSNELAAKYAAWELDVLNEKLLDALDFGFMTEQEAEVLSDKITIAYGQMGMPGGDTFADFKKLSEPEQVAWLVSLTPKSLENFDAVEIAGLQLMVDELYLDKKISAIEHTMISESIFNMTPFKPTPSTINLPDLDSMTPVSALANILSMTSNDWDKLNPQQKQFVHDKFEELDASGTVSESEYKKYEKITGQSLPDVVKDLVGGETNYALESAILMMTQSEYDALSKDEKVKLYDDGSKLSDPTGAIEKKLVDLIKTHVATNFVNPFTSPAARTASPKVSFDWDDNSGPYGTSPIFYDGQVIAYADSSPDGSGAQIYDIDPDNPASYGSFVGTVDFDAGDSVPQAVITLIDTGMLSVTAPQPYTPNVVDESKITVDFDNKSGPQGTTPVLYEGSPILWAVPLDDGGTILYAVNDSGGLGKIAVEIGDTGQTVSEAAVELVQAGDISLPSGPAISNVTKVPTPVVTPAPVGSKFFVDVHGKIKQAALISTPANPAPPASVYKIKTPSGAAAMQQTMLNAAGKVWTGPQTSAIKKYGTSVGYRSINAVLRDDPKQLKLFNDAQLADAVKHAVNLQDAMTPLTDDVKLFRGTGAHAFGQSTISANFDELKKLQGSVVTDKGFLSTTVDENKGVSYDYAKKPIQVVFSAPAGTPALHVDSAIPGHSEHEVLLAAGTSYRVDEVRKATAADRAKYGNPNLEHVVEATIVPSPAGGSTPLGAPAAKPASAVAPTTLTPGTPSAPVSATKVGPIKASDLNWPMKITTSVIHTMKYQHGAVVAYRKNPDGSLSRLAWSGTTKKFISQNQQLDGSWQTFAGYTKKDAYGTFGKAGYAGSWFSPPPGDSAIGSGGPFGTTTVAPKVSTSAPAPSTVMTAPAPAPIKQQKFDADEIQKLHGQIPPGVGAGYQRQLFDSFKKNTSVGFVQLSSPEGIIFTALAEILDKHNDDAKGTATPQLNMLQLLKIIDVESTNKANAIAKSKGETGDLVNAQLYEKKLIAWLQTPSGATYATELLYPPPPAAFDLSGPINAVKVYKSPNYTPQIVDTLHKIKDPALIGTPDPDATSFTPIGATQARNLQKQMLASDPWTTSQQNALTKYTGSYYTTMNPVVRDLAKETKNWSETTMLTAARTAVNVQAGMRPLPQNVKVYRRTDPSQFSAFGLTKGASFADIKKIEGKLFIDRAPMSTSVDPNKWQGSVRFEIDLPKGTPAAYVDDISENKGELEMILALGLKYRIISVKQEYGITKVHMRVEA